MNVADPPLGCPSDAPEASHRVGGRGRRTLASAARLCLPRQVRVRTADDCRFLRRVECVIIARRDTVLRGHDHAQHPDGADRQHPATPSLIQAIAATDGSDPALEALYDAAVRDTIEQFEATGSPVITDGEQRKYHNFWTYCVQGLANTAPDGFKIPFAAGHTRRMLRLTGGPFRYHTYADRYLDVALRYAHRPVKQAVISPSALSLMYPPEPIPGYSREQFIADLLREHETEVRNCLRKGAHRVQIDFTEGRLAVKTRSVGRAAPPVHRSQQSRALTIFRSRTARRIGVHTCPGSDLDSTHSADVDYAALLPSLFELMAGCFYRCAGWRETDPAHVLRIIRDHLKPDQMVFVGVINPTDPRDRDGRGSLRASVAGRRVHSAGATGHLRRLWVRALL